MQSYFHPIPKPPAPSPTVQVPEPQEEIPEDPYPDLAGIGETFKGYYSDEKTSSNELDEWSEDETEPKEKEPNNSEAAPPQAQGADPEAHFHVCQPPPLKRWKLAVPARAACQNAKDAHRKELEIGLKQIEKLMPSRARRTDLPPGQITSCGIILSVSSETVMRAAYFYGWQTHVCSLATGLLNSRPLLRWLYRNQVNNCMTLPSHFAQLFF
jgi:hypothetical protein